VQSTAAQLEGRLA